MIDILLATYNGEKYIKTQIYSLLTQTHKDWRLLIHDDGSTDKTIEIIKEFQKLDSRILLIEDEIKCGGAGANFLHLLKNYAEAEFIIFCDQDDIWLENKLEVMYERLKKEKDPCAVFANGYLYAPKEGITGEIPSPKLQNFKDLLFIAGGLQGCSLMFNKKLLDIIKDYDGYMTMHDFLITLGAISFGQLIYLDDKLMLYRQQHEGKTTSNADTSINSRMKNRFPVIDEKHHRSFVGFYEKYKGRFNDNQKYLFSEYLKIYHSKNLLQCIGLVLKNQFKLNHSSLYLIMKMLLRPIR